MIPRDEVDAYFGASRPRPHRPRRGVLRVRRRARLPGRDRGAREGRARRARPAHVLQDLRPRRPARRLRRRADGGRDAVKKVRNAFDVTQPAQDAALASLGDDEELARRRASNAESRARCVERCCAARPALAPSPGGELRLRGGRGRPRAGLRAAAARGRDRPPARRLRRARRDPGDGRDPRRRTSSSRRRSGASSAPRGRWPGRWTRDELVEGVRGGDRRALARAITLVENGDPLAYELIRELYPETGRAYAIGVTGPPGVGKSSLISALVRLVRGRAGASASSPSTRRARSRRARSSATASA